MFRHSEIQIPTIPALPDSISFRSGGFGGGGAGGIGSGTGPGGVGPGGLGRGPGGGGPGPGGAGLGIWRNRGIDEESKFVGISSNHNTPLLQYSTSPFRVPYSPGSWS
jgi:hypothetical protein